MKPRKGIVLAGGTSSRLFPSTKVISKQLLPLYDKPLIYYPLSILMLAGIKDILIITTPHDSTIMQDLLGSGKQLGISLSYAIQEKPEGIAQAFLVAEEFLDGAPSALILGDNVFYGSAITGMLTSTGHKLMDTSLAAIFGKRVNDPERFGVAEINEYGTVLSLEEKPTEPASNIAVVGLYFYPADVVDRVRTLKPSSRGEYEITDLNKSYLQDGKLILTLLGRGVVWADTGTPTSLHNAASYLHSLEILTGQKVACLEEVALRKRFIGVDDFTSILYSFPNNDYKQYLVSVLGDYLDA